MFGGLQLWQDTIKKLKFTTDTVQVSPGDETARVSQVFDKCLLQLPNLESPRLCNRYH